MELPEKSKNQNSFIGRRAELQSLVHLRSKKTASLVCLLGRRRIGKSHLLNHFGLQFKRFVRIQGLGPETRFSVQNQLDHFAIRLSEQLNKKKAYFDDWTEAFSYLAQEVKTGEVLIVLDEISWMGRGDPLFAAKLKDAWDTQFKNNSKLILTVCGSVSTWIEENILKNVSFEGRISLQINLQELSLPEIYQFWSAQKSHFGSLEQILLLSMTGGVPKYLEEIDPHMTADQNMTRLCFETSGLLYNEFEHIFLDIFGRKTKVYEKIIRLCSEKKLSQADIARLLKSSQNSELSEHIHHLEVSGFVSRDFYFKPDGEASKLSHIRVKDNYLRFYLKYIEPLKKKIEKGGKKIQSFSDLANFEGLLGLQFENLLLKNRSLIYPLLNLSEKQIVSAAPYAQRKTTMNKGACQIDLLIHSDLDTFFLCEFKCKKRIDRTVINDVKKKMSVLKLPKRSALKPVLVYEGELQASSEEEISEFFYKTIHWTELLKASF